MPVLVSGSSPASFERGKAAERFEMILEDGTNTIRETVSKWDIGFVDSNTNIRVDATADMIAISLSDGFAVMFPRKCVGSLRELLGRVL